MSEPLKPELTEDLTIQGRRPVVVIVDDEPLFLEIVRRRVKRNRSWEVHAFDNPLLALNFLRDHPVDVLLSDIYMIEMDGIEFLAQAREIAQDVVQILMTGESERDKTIEAINRLDLYFFFEKDRIWNELSMVLRNALEKKKLSMNLRQRIEELEETNARLNAIQDDLLRQKKRAVIGELIQGTCHNINTPLSVILGHVELLHWQLKHGQREVVPDEIVEKIATIQEAAERIQDITYNLMIKSRLDQSPKRQEISLNELVTRELKFLHADAFFRHKVEVTTELDPKVPPLLLNYGDLSQIFGNLIRNALDAMFEVEQPQLRITSSRQADDVVVEIHDNGPGVPLDLRERIFDPFFSTKREVKDTRKHNDPGLQHDVEPSGMGLGLYSVTRLLDPYKGTIEVDDSPLGGACFRLRFPRANNSH